MTAASAGDDVSGFMNAAFGLRLAADFLAVVFFAAGFLVADFLALFLAIRSFSHRLEYSRSPLSRLAAGTAPACLIRLSIVNGFLSFFPLERGVFAHVL